MVKDHLGNVRATLTDEWQQDNYPAATMETGSRSTENTYYSKLEDTYTPVSTIANYPASSSANQPNAAVAKLNKSTQPIGPGILLKVMAGDRINLQCDMWYRTSGATPDNSGTNVFASLLLQLASGVPGASGGHLEIGQTGSSGSFFGGPVTDFLRSQPAPAASKPQASVNWLLLDEQFGWQQDNGSGSEPVGDNEAYKHFVKGCGDAIEVQKSGYIYVYTSNQSNIDVYFDNLQVSMVYGPLLEETHYYPFGLTMQGISSKAAGKLNNKLKYNSKEEQRQEFSDGSGLDWLDYGARMYDNQIGRWQTQDPMATSYLSVSPYNYCLNNPINGIDPTGKDVIFINGSTAVHGLGHAAVIIGSSTDGWYYYSINGTESGGDPYGDSYKPDVGTNLGHSTDIRQLIKDANTVNPNEKHDYDRFVIVKTTKEEDAAMKVKAAEAASKKKYNFFNGQTCLTVNKVVYEELTSGRVGFTKNYLDYQLRDQVIPNSWFNMLPTTLHHLNTYMERRGVGNGQYFKQPPTPVIIVDPITPIGPVPDKDEIKQ